MKNTIFKYLAIGLILIFSFACSDFLEEANPNEMSTDSFWKTVDDCNTGLTGVYNAFKNGNIMSFTDENNRSDMTWPGWGRPNTTNSSYIQTFTEASDAPNRKWDALYKVIFRANQVIAALDNLSGTYTSADEEKRALEIMAQAKFYRGLSYFYLHSTFNKGSVIIYDFVPADEADFYQTVRPAEEVRAFFTTDLEFAYKNLPANWLNKNEVGRATAGAAAAVLGQSYLYAADYEKAKLYFKDVIENTDYGYALTANIGDNFTTQKELNSESILEIVYSLAFKAEISAWAEEQTSTNLARTFAPAGIPGGYRSVIPSCWLIMAYKTDKMDINDPRNYITNTDGTQRLRAYSLRTSYSIALPNDLDLLYYGGQTCPQIGPFNNQETAYWRKYTNWDIVKSEKDIIPNDRSGINIRVIRLADVYLMYAESLIKGGTDGSGVTDAMKYINKVRKRSALQLLGLNGTGEFPTADHDNKVYDAKGLMDHIMYIERPLELSAEGHATRQIDLRRWGITKKRFEDLSLEKFYRIDYKYTDVAGKIQTKWGSVIQQEVVAGQTPMIDFIQAATNYNESAHAYWPLPSNELVSNPVLIK